MNAANSKPGPSRRTAPLATLLATISLFGVEQALVPAPASAVTQDGEICTYLPFLLECQERDGDGGGGPVGAGGSVQGTDGTASSTDDGGPSDDGDDYEREHRDEIEKLNRELEKDATAEDAEDRERAAREQMEQLRQAEELDARLLKLSSQWNDAARQRESERSCSALVDPTPEDLQACRAVTVTDLSRPKKGGQCSSLQAPDDRSFCAARYALQRKQDECDSIDRRAAIADGPAEDSLWIVEEFLACAAHEREMRKSLLQRARKRIRAGRGKPARSR